MPILITVNPGVHMAAGIILFTVVHRVPVIVVHTVDAVKYEVVDYLESKQVSIIPNHASLCVHHCLEWRFFNIPGNRT
jgi:formate-dependent phosphoribosylglycinamide formyltransferase (GAR transformylase)